MIPRECKRLVEVDFPIAEISRHAVAENNVRHGHPKTLHLWWARRPLASSRAVLLGLLLPDPVDPLCPVKFKDQARRLLREVPGRTPGAGDGELRHGLLAFIADFANWGLSSNPTYIKACRGLVKAAQGDDPPLVVDPFAGGGSIPLEALRLGCEAFASDINPVACLMLKALLEDVPRNGPKIVEDLLVAGAEIKRGVEGQLAKIYPEDADKARPIAYLWARTVRCEAPNCGAEIPLIRSFWLGKKPKRRQALKYSAIRSPGQAPRVEFEIFTPVSDKDLAHPSVTGARATCMCCGAVVSPERVRAQLSEHRGGADVVFDSQGRRTGGALMLAVVTQRAHDIGRHYRLPSARDYKAVHESQVSVRRLEDSWRHAEKDGLSPVPNEILNPIRPSPNARGLSGVTRYGMTTFGDLFTARQKLALASLAEAVSKHAGDAVRPNLAMVVSKLADYSNSLCRWRASSECADALFGRKAIPMVWDFAEPCPFADAAGSWQSMLDRSSGGLASAYVVGTRPATVQLADAATHPLPDESAAVWFSDPPYYDSIPYADLADFFLVWLKRALPGDVLLQDPFDKTNRLSPKERECVWNKAHSFEGREKDKAFFEGAMGRAFAEARRVLRNDGIGAVVFAHKTTEGWEALLTGITKGGWTITASWPIATEMRSRLNARDNASLATSVHLVCRRRSEDAPIGDWSAVLRELPKRVGDWMEHLQTEGVRGADLVFACIGPALEVFSRYKSVETAEGREVKLDEYLEKVWEVVGRTALENVLGTAEAVARNGSGGALEEDARLTALFLWTLQSSEVPGEDTNGEQEPGDENGEDGEEDEDSGSKKGKGFALVFDVVRRFAQPLGIELSRWDGRIVETDKGVVRLLSVAERAKQLFGVEGAQAVAARIEENANVGVRPQLSLFANGDGSIAHSARRGKGKAGRGHAAVISEDDLHAPIQATTLDRVHIAMLLQSGGRTNALRALLKDEHDRGSDFLRLANALSALYPKASEERRLVEAMLHAVPR